MRPMSVTAIAAYAALVTAWPTNEVKDALPEGTEQANRMEARYLAECVYQAMQKTGADTTDCRMAFGAWVGSNAKAGREAGGWDADIVDSLGWLLA